MTIRQRFPRSAFLVSLALSIGLARTHAAAAQERPPQERPNSVYLELGGSGVGATVNYERMLSSRFNVRLGGGAYPDEVARGVFVAMSNVVLGRQRHQFSAGMGVVAVQPPPCSYCADEPTDWEFATELGYRYHSTSGFLLKATVAVFPGEAAEGAWWAWPGVSLGWSF